MRYTQVGVAKTTFLPTVTGTEKGEERREQRKRGRPTKNRAGRRETGRWHTRTSRIILDRRELGTHPRTLRGVEEAGLRGRDEADDERAIFIFFKFILFCFVVEVE